MRKPAAKKKAAKSKVKNVKPKEYAGVLYKSSLEAYTAQALTEAGLPVNYEKVSFPIAEPFTCSCPSMEFRLKKNKAVPLTQNIFAEISNKVLAMKYTPDFTDLESDFKWVCEDKGLVTQEFAMRFKLFKAYCTRMGFKYQIYMPNKKEHVDAMVQHILINRKA